MVRHALSQGQRETLIAMWKLGESINEIANVLGCPKASVQYYREFMGLPERYTPPPPPVVVPLDDNVGAEEICEPYDAARFAHHDLPHWVRFENITKAEARRILADAPQSAPFARLFGGIA